MAHLIQYPAQKWPAKCLWKSTSRTGAQKHSPTTGTQKHQSLQPDLLRLVPLRILRIHETISFPPSSLPSNPFWKFTLSMILFVKFIYTNFHMCITGQFRVKPFELLTHPHSHTATFPDQPSEVLSHKSHLFQPPWPIIGIDGNPNPEASGGHWWAKAPYLYLILNPHSWNNWICLHCSFFLCCFPFDYF